MSDIDILKKAIARKHPCDECHKALKRLGELREVALALREWVDAVPEDTTLPTMPGVDRDWVDGVLDT